MRKILLSAIFAVLFFAGLYSCQKTTITQDPGKCPHATDGLLFRKWASVFVKAEQYDSNGKIIKSSCDRPAGFIQFGSDGSYSAISDGLSVIGKWSFDKNCNLGLTAGGNLGIAFEIVTLTSDSLTIRKKIGTSVFTQHYRVYSCDYQQYLVRKWVNTYTKTDTYGSDGSTIISSTTIKPVGFFQLSNDGTYRVLSDNIPLNGKWNMNADRCELTLDTGTSLQRTFEIVAASCDSLVIRRKDGNIAYTQHYRAYICPTLAQLEQTWDNTMTTTNSVFNGTLGAANVSYPVGYFRLNANQTYNVDSNGVPLDGQWVLLDQSQGCPLVLDPNNSLKRSFDILKITSDSLIIYRQDILNNIIYTQEYKKH